ncbi:MAG: AsmA family protein [Betaproteobacteria bacterium]
MNKTTVFSKTGKGLLEIKNKSNRLSKDQFRVLNLVDGKATLVDLVNKSRVPEVELRKVLTVLSDGGFIKEFSNPAAGNDYGSATMPPVPPNASYADDLDFTQILGPAKAKPAFYQSAVTEQRQREEGDRIASEAAAGKAREQAEKKNKIEAERRAKEEEVSRRIREDAEQKAKEEQSRRAKLEAEMRDRIDGPKRAKEEAERKARERADLERRAKEEVERKVREKLAADKKAREEEERKAADEVDRRAKIQAEALARVEAERRRLQEEEQKRRDDEERRRKEDEARKREQELGRQRKEEEERKRQEDDKRRQREEEERKLREADERRKREDEDRKRREDEERKRREDEETKRRDEEEHKKREEEERVRREEEERKRREDEEKKRREEEERLRREEEERRAEDERKRIAKEERKRREEEERLRRAEEERLHKEEEERQRKEEQERQRKALEERHRKEHEALQARLEQEKRDLEDGVSLRELEDRKRRADEESKRESDERDRQEQAQRLQREQEQREREQQERDRREADERRARENAERERSEKQAQDEDDLPSLDLTESPATSVASSFNTDLDALRRAEQEVEKEFLAKEETIRRALEEQERRFRLEDEARHAMDRAERESRECADREAIELSEAAERARKEAELRAREEATRRQADEKAQRARDQEERKKRSEEDRNKRERERREGEQRSREESLAKQRADQEERDRKKSDRERLGREAKKGGWGPARMVAIVAGSLIVLAIGVVQFAPLSAYAPEIEKMASDALGEPVHVGGVHASMFPSFHIRLDNVVVGAQQDVRAPTVTAFMDLGSAMGNDKVIKTLQIDGLQANSEVMPRLSGWLFSAAAKSRKLRVQRVVLKDIKLEVKSTSLPPFDSQLYIGVDGALLRATIDSKDGHLSAEIMPSGAEADVTAQLKNFTLPLGPSFEFTEGHVKGRLSSGQLRLNDMDLYLYGGQVGGHAVLSWGQTWSLEGDFEAKRVDLEPSMRSLKIDIASEGRVDAKGRYSAQSNTVETLFNNSRADGNFVIQKGSLAGLDLVRALQTQARDGVQGGKTKFDEMNGNFAVNGNRFNYSNVRLVAGLLNASGSGEVLPNKEVAGRAYVELRSPSNVVKGTFRVTGDMKAIVIKP